MNLFKWTKNISPKFPNKVERFLGKNIDEYKTSSEEIATIPSVNIIEKKKSYEIKLAIPGVDKKDLKLEMKEDCLIISSEKQYEHAESEEDFLRREYGYAAFRRIFKIPDNADPNHIDASLKNGILKITLNKIKGKENSVKEIKVK